MRAFLAAFLVFLASSALAQRIVPTADVTMYVAPPASCANGYWPGTPNVAVTTCGSDATGDGTQAAPFATPQKAHDTLAALYDFQCKWKPTIQLGVANVGSQWYYPGLLISGRLLGQCGTVAPLKWGAPPQTLPIGKYLPYTLRGDPANVNGAFFFPASFGSRPCISMSEAALKVEGITCDTSGVNQDCIDVFANSHLEIGNVWFGNCGYPQSFLVIGAAWGSSVLFTGAITVSGSGGSFMQVATGTVQGNSDSGSPTIPITILNNPTFTQGFFVIDAGSVVYGASLSISGPFVGTKVLTIRGGQYQPGPWVP